VTLRAYCNICTAKIPNGMLNTSFHTCQRCEPFSEEYQAEVNKLITEGWVAIGNKIESMRNRFLQEKVLAKKQELKAV
jgi:predicted PP-loop superfamily ATPase